MRQTHAGYEVLNAISACVLQTDERWRIRFANEAAVAVIGLPFLFFRRGWFGGPPGTRGSGSGGGGGAGVRASRVETAFLRMTLDRATGVMTGEVLRGTFAGHGMDRLDQDQLLQLRAECERDDPQSIPLVEAYLDRRFGTDWRRSGGPQGDSAGSADGREAPPRASNGPMARAEALEILGLQEGADRAAVISAWRRLIKLAHPDHGGSKYLAAKLNEAKRVLLDE